MYIDLSDPQLPSPQRGDQLLTTRSRYWVLRVRQVKRRDPEAPRRFMLVAVRDDEMKPAVMDALLKGNVRRGGAFEFTFRWYERKKKTKTFEELMRNG